VKRLAATALALGALALMALMALMAPSGAMGATSATSATGAVGASASPAPGGHAVSQRPAAAGDARAGQRRQGGPYRVRPGAPGRRALPPRRPVDSQAFAAARQLPGPPPPPPGFLVPPPPLPPGAPRPRPLQLGMRDPYRSQRHEMVTLQLRQRGISQPEVLAAMEQVPRHLFLPERMRAEAYTDRALQVGPSRTIYQPYVVALMTSLLDLKSGDTVLEVGTGTGYHAAVLSRIARQVYSIEIDPTAASQAERALSAMGYHNVEVWAGDGYRGLPEKAPFNAILLSAAPPRIPEPLIDQLQVGGRMVAPVGGGVQDLLVITKTRQGIEKRTVAPVRVSPMTGQVQDGH
jgi:protein-L-isoaspartate(D-aspartate) O-methyltransferase